VNGATTNKGANTTSLRDKCELRWLNGTCKDYKCPGVGETTTARQKQTPTIKAEQQAENTEQKQSVTNQKQLVFLQRQQQPPPPQQEQQQQQQHCKYSADPIPVAWWLDS
jgi:hypothetical protein